MGMGPFHKSSAGTCVYKIPSEGTCLAKSPEVIEVRVPIAVPEKMVKSVQKQFDMNPKPNVFKILKTEQIGEYCIVKINYPNCKNYEGNKILVFKSDIVKIISLKVIDPHFNNDRGLISPVARFEPTLDGYKMAYDFCKMLDKKVKKC